MTFPCYCQSKPSKHLLGLPCPRHHCVSHRVLQGHDFPQVGHRGLCSFLFSKASGLCGETLQDMWIVKTGNTGNKECRSWGTQHLALPRTTFLPTDTDMAYPNSPNVCWPQEWGNQIISTSDFLCLHSTSKYAKK